MNVEKMESIVSDLENLDYPGRKKPVNRGTAAQPVPDTAVWDEHPFRARMPGTGVETDFYLIAHLAKALDYSVQSIRAWEDKGLLPRSGYRSQRPKGKPQAAGSHKGKRLWTREQVEGIVRLARRHKVILNKRAPTQAFARDVQVLFDQLRSKQ